MSLFRCPLCAAPLEREAGTYRSGGGHSFDLAREGYVHLLPPNQKHSALPGDDREMVLARRDFLSKGYYHPLLNTFCSQISALSSDAPVLLDAGCGEGFYTAAVRDALLADGRSPAAAGIDISKFSVQKAAKRYPGIAFAVASAYRLPVAAESVDLLLNVFSPLAIDEFRRVLRPGGAYLYVVPAARHLWQLKEVLYDRPYPNEERETPYEGFAYQEILPVSFTVHLPAQADIRALFQMTPYYWKTPRQGAARLAALETLACEMAFHIHVFRREAAS